MARLGDKWMIQTPATGGGWSPWEEIYTKYYGTECESMSPVQTNPHPEYRKTLGGTFRYYGAKPKGTMTGVWLVGGADWTFEHVNAAIAQMRADMQHVKLKRDDAEYVWECVLTNWVVADTGVNTYIRITCTWDVIQNLGVEAYDIEPGASMRFANRSTSDTGIDARITILSGANSLLFDVLGAKLMNVKEGEVWEFRGMTTGQVFCNGVPALSRTAFYDVPRLHPGDNVITCPDHCRMHIEFLRSYV